MYVCGVGRVELDEHSFVLTILIVNLSDLNILCRDMQYFILIDIDGSILATRIFRNYNIFPLETPVNLQ